MVSFKIQSVCVTCAFNSNTKIEELVPGVEFSPKELDLECENSSNDFDDLGNFKAFKLNKLDKVMISNTNKGIEPFLLQFKLMSKLMRSMQMLNEAKPKYIDSPYRMDNEKPIGYLPLDEVFALIQPNESVMKVLFGMK